MGAGQSASRDENEQGAASPVKTCYYELLGLDRQASDEE